MTMYRGVPGEEHGDKHIITIRLVERGDTSVAFILTDDWETVELPQHLAAQLPMAMNMLKAQTNAIRS